MAKIQKKSFILYCEQKEVMDDLSKEEVGILIYAIFDYVENGIIPSFKDRTLNLAFKLIKRQLDFDKEKYEKICKQNSENQRKRWNTTKEKENNTGEYDRIRPNTTLIRSDTEYTDNRIYDNRINDNGESLLSNDNIDSKEKIDNKINLSSTKKRFTKPTPEEVDEYCKQMTDEGKEGYNFSGQQFVDYYESKGWLIGKSPMKDWKAACRTWANGRKKKEIELKPPTPEEVTANIKNKGITSANFWDV